jgi:hypothetical protein
MARHGFLLERPGCPDVWSYIIRPVISGLENKLRGPRASVVSYVPVRCLFEFKLTALGIMRRSPKPLLLITKSESARVSSALSQSATKTPFGLHTIPSLHTLFSF